ncbi:MAG: hypothetical protein ABSF10_11980 [Verrucomicrobiota bacterium]|jgi:hypothetical protein
MPDNGNNRFLPGTTRLALVLFVCGLAIFCLVFQIGKGQTSSNGTYKLREVSVFESGQNNFIRGQMCRCQDKPFPEVKNYPAFTSEVPIFGSVRFGGRLDETNSGLLFYFAVDESRGTGKGFDRLYFDANRDLDLRNDPVVKLRQPPPDHGYKPNFSGIKAVAAFDFLKVNLGTNGGSSDLVEIMPRLLLTGDDKQTYRYLFFVRTRLFEGDIRMAGEKFHAQLGNDYVISPSFDFPGTALELSGKKTSFNWWGGDRISAIHKMNGRFFSFSATQDGELTVRPYSGDLGTFEIGPGTRKLTNFGVSGSFEARDWAVPVGGDIKDGRPVEVSRCQVPVGDYLPEFLTLQFGRLRIQLSQNYHSEGKRQNRTGRPDVYGITIRKDRPYVLDFSNQPDVMFTSPTNSQRVKPGDTLMVAAVLVDPKLDIMIRRLDDTSHKQTKDAEGKPLHYEQNLSLDPKVIIMRANGEKVAEGVMPFG